MPGLLIGYACVSTEEQDLTAQRDGLQRLGVEPSRIYVDHGLTGTNRDRPGLREALAACRAGDTLVVTKLDRLARSLPDARAIAEDLTRRTVRLSLGGSVYDPADPVGRLLFNVLAMVAEFEADLIRSRTREGMRVAKAKGSPARQAAQAQPPPGGAPDRTAAHRRIHHRRTGRPVRRGPLHRLPRTCPQQAGSARGQAIGQCVGAPCGAAPRHAPFAVGRDENDVPAAARRAQRLPLREPEPSARAITPPEPTPHTGRRGPRSPEGSQGDSRPILPCRKWFRLRTRRRTANAAVPRRSITPWMRAHPLCDRAVVRPPRAVTVHRRR